MRYAESFANRQLGHSRESVADESRRAALDFMSGVAEGWTKFDLALWLHGPYALASRYAPREERSRTARAASVHAIEEPTIEQLLVSARGQILAALELAALVGGAPDFIESAFIERHVRRGIDSNGTTAWVPVDAARMKLKDRVASLFVADYMNRPDDYEHLYVCHSCEGVTFERGAKERGRCGVHRVSGVVPKSKMERPVRTGA